MNEKSQNCSSAQAGPAAGPSTRAVVHSLDHFGLIVPDLVEADRFFCALGLEVRTRCGGLELHAPGDGHCWTRIIKGERKRLHYLSFGAYPADLPAIRERAERQGLIAAPPAGADHEGLWLRGPEGLPVQVRAAAKVSADEKPPFETRSSPAGVAGARPHASIAPPKPSRLSHVAIFTRDVDAAMDFYCGLLGLKLADRSGEGLAFLHAQHGSDHHILALCKSEGTGVHHYSWDMGSLDAIELAAARTVAQGYASAWGLGRHVLGSNYFHYMRDPWGSYAEFTADIDFIPAGCPWAAGDHPPEDAMYLWGPPPPEDFIANRELALEPA